MDAKAIADLPALSQGLQNGIKQTGVIIPLAVIKWGIGMAKTMNPMQAANPLIDAVGASMTYYTLKNHIQ